MRPTLSVIIPLHNGRKYIQATLDSLFRQTLQDFEILLIDHASGDGTASFVRAKYKGDARLKIFFCSTALGSPSAPRNLGLDLALGRYIAFCDGDDLWHPRKAEIQIGLLEQVMGGAACSAMADLNRHSMVESSPDIFSSIKCPEALPISSIGFVKQLIKYRTPTSSLIFDARDVKHIRFNESYEFRGREDLLFLLQYLENKKYIYKIDCPLVFYRIHDSQISGKKIMILKRHFKTLKYYFKDKNFVAAVLFSLFFSGTHIILSIYLRFLRNRL